MSYLDEIWSWIYEPLQELKESYVSEPEARWADRRERFIAKLGLLDSAGHPLVEELTRHLDQLSDADRDALAASDELDTLAYNLAQQHAAEQEAAEQHAAEQAASAAAAVAEPHYDEAAWGQFLTANGSFWDGTEASWAQYRDWFAAAAAAQGFGAPAAGLLNYLEAQAVPDRIAALALYGVNIAQAVQPAAAPDAPQEPSPGRDEFAQSLMDELLASQPELAAIPEARRWELLAEVLNQQ
jgi:hypothetical protein